MKDYTIIVTVLSSMLLSACAGGETLASFSQATERVIFKCTLKDTNRSFLVTEKDGKVSFNGQAYSYVGVSKYEDSDARSYIFEGANVIDGVSHNVALTIGTGRNPDSVGSDGDVFQCKFKATVNSAVLDALASRGEALVAAVVAKADELNLCEGERDPELGFGRSFGATAINAEEWIVPVYCSMGAYQGSYQLVRWNSKTARGKVLSVEQYDSGTRRITLTTQLGGVPGGRPDTGLTNFAKGRGLGDCGVYEFFKPLQGDILRLSQVRAKDECDGVYVEPSEWPLVFRAP